MKFKHFFERYLPFLYSQQTYLAFDVEKARTRYPLSKARYIRMASYIHHEHTKCQKPLRVLDIGCNEGMMILYCRRNQTPVEFYGIDVLPEKKEQSLQKGYQDVFLGDLRDCPFNYPPDFFDAVICSHILEHLEDPAGLLKKIRLILKKEGLLMIGIPTAPMPFIIWRKYVTPLIDPVTRAQEAAKRFGHLNFFTIKDMQALLKTQGFKTEEVHGDFFIRARGFFLENFQWWFAFNQWCGKIAPHICGQVTIKAINNP